MKTAFQLLACLLAIESAVALSVPARRTPIDIPDNGDGLYVVQVDENNIPIGVEFTALADVQITERAVERADITPVPHALLDKRAGVSCSGGIGNTDIDSAQGCLASAAGSGVQWGYHSWVYCKSGTAVAYACNYQANTVTYAIIANMIQVVDTTCGNYGYGYYRCTNGCSIYDLAVGRDVNGNVFCASGVTG